ncbi:MAG: hypothetical protein HY901_21650 [Deltaproteobacteria bacterium]|nr:hypothetical protein [Deltaproteobacteria bacterium]
MGSRWDHLYEIKPVPLAEHFVEEVSKLVAKDLTEWPLAIESWTSAQEEERFKPLLGPDSSRPDGRVLGEAFRLARWELMREFEQIDEYMRHERWREVTPAGRGVDQILLVCRYLTEQMLAIIEATGGRIKRPQLVDLLLRAERRLMACPLG